MKSGIDYFPLDVTLDDKFELIEAEFSLTGFAVVVKLFQKIYGGQGYYCDFTNEVALLFSRSVGLGGNVVSEIVAAAIKRGIFNKNLFEKYQVLTSAGIQKRYCDAVSRRKQFEIKNEYLLFDVTQNYKNVNISGENVNINDKNVYISKQSREEKSKVEYSREEESKALADGKTKFAEFVFLTPKEHEDLIKEKGEDDTAELIRILNVYKGATGKIYSSDYFAIKKWVIKKLEEDKAEKTTAAVKQKPPRYDCKVEFNAEQAKELSWNIIEETVKEKE